MHGELLPLRIDLPFGRREGQVATTGGEQLAITLERPWVRGEVLVRRELQTVDEDADDHEAVSRSSDSDE
jgi:hypothetical protein